MRIDRPTLALICLGLAVLGYSLNPLMIRWSEIGSIPSAFWRLALAVPMIPLIGLFVDRGWHRDQISSADYARMAFAGLFIGADMALWYIAVNTTSILNATLLVSIQPLLVGLAGFVLLGERYGRTFIGGVALACGGAVVIVLGKSSAGVASLTGDLAAVGAALFYALYFILLAGVRARVGTVVSTLWTTTWALVVMTPLLILYDEGPLIPPSAYGWWILWLQAAQSLACQMIVAWALAYVAAGFAAATGYAQPFLSALLAWILLGETLSPVSIAGGVLVIMGLVLATSSKPQRAPAPATAAAQAA
ncbi:DMT family transporter [Zavarzinia sp. CC-PAN008]|uniref:DMT family transporter n=1 Tax=Zavarzinia sp. CC-PAN008 TaxID=3243332 RepID=UPI003F742D76